MSINVKLPPHFEHLIREKVASGQYGSASEVVLVAMRLFEEQDRLRALKLEQLRCDIEDGLNSGEPSKWDPQEVKRLGRARRTENQLS